MQKNNNVYNRRSFLKLGTGTTILALLPCSMFHFKDSRTVTWKLIGKDRELGVKLSQTSKGFFLITLRDLKGKRLAVIPLGKPDGNVEQSKISKSFKLKDGSSFAVTVKGDATISSSLKAVTFGRPNHRPADTTQGFFSWLKDVVHDVGVAIAAGAAFLTGGFGEFTLKSGGHISVGAFGTIQYRGGFKLEPGMEEDPTVWY